MPLKSGYIFLILLAIVVLGLFYFSVRLNSPPSYEKLAQAPDGKKTTADVKPAVTPADPSLGPAKALVTIIEYADFRCPHCALADLELKKILQAYPDKVRLVWKDFPFLPPLPVTWLAHEAARCAEKQKKFWEYHDALFANQENLNREKLVALAKELGLDEARFAACLDSGETRPLVSRGFEEGKAAGVDGTPYFFVNGEKWAVEMTAEKIGGLIKSLRAE